MVKKIIGVISDTHGLLRDEVVRELQGCDLIIHAGDVGSQEVINLLNKIAPVKAVRGNVDKAQWCYDLPMYEVIEIQEKYVYIIHNIEDIDIEPKAAGIDVIIFGHSHKPVLMEKEGIIYLNPGSSGPKRFNLPITFAILEIENNNINIRHINVERGT